MDIPGSSSQLCGTFTKDDFDTDWRKVGESRFAQVFQVRLKKGQQKCALKVLDATLCGDDFYRRLMDEALVVSRVRLKFVVSLYGRCSEASALVMEFMSNGSLNNLLTSHTLMWPKKFQMIHEVSMGMSFLHGLQPPLLHLNLKTSNILVDDHLHLKISDVATVRWEEGMSNRELMERLSTRGNMSYIPPETFSPRSEAPGTAFDVYSFAIVMWEILAQQKPHAGCSVTYVILSVSQGKRPRVEIVPEPRPSWCDHMIRVMTHCWDQEPRSRPEFTDIVKDLDALCDGTMIFSTRMTDDTLETIDPEIPSSVSPDLASDQLYGQNVVISFLSRKDFGSFRQTVKKEDVFTKFPGERSLLHFAIASGDELSVRHVLSLGADVNSATARGYTALIIAVLKRSHENISLLLDYGADVSRADEDQWTPLHFAVQNGDDRTVRLLLDKGASADSCEKGGWTPLHLACQNGHETVVRLLLSRMTNDAVEAKERGQLRTPLHLAAAFGHVHIVKLLLSQGADPNTVDQTLSTALHLAAEEGHNRVVRHLIKTGTSVNSVNSRGYTALHLGALSGHTGICRQLLSNQASSESRTHQGWTPLHLAALKGHEATVAQLVEQGSCLNAGGDNGWTPLHLACHHGHSEVVDKLLDAKADPDVTEEDEGWTPLHVACTSVSLSAVLHLISHNAAVNVVNKERVTPLHMAAQCGSSSIVEVLLQNGADRSLTDSCGASALNVAQRSQRWEIVEMLERK